ncbi:NAD(P)/FAD-dependent oxidoreductase [Amycolatopsis cynarae]|uniref:NAD(P)/FAD-dependent oxidoreductase n=1 Tax=Amycolatopsis cynarae TaxID=2995223 RepID=A0ABY7B659_9PSEU|nr:NAD(P)/FAD-dependent oxidoreductase [Amycolatopsis sp. HUAS 11-8]WAL66909.1 NAD(P)/FAD-dependent oxidoreductase [Amycolatopsis sp. HUAS 11-8]
MKSEKYDVVVIGAGSAGLSGALALARSRRSVLVIDAGEPRNAPAGHVHNYLGRENTPPAELRALGRAEVTGYGGEMVDARVLSAETAGDGFRLRLDTGRTVAARRLLVATGAVDELPDLPGLAQRWGRDVLHCAYCHGWEVQDRAIGILATGPMAVHQALLFRQLSEDVVLFGHLAEPAAADTARLAARGIRVVPGEVAALEVTGDTLTGVRLRSGELVPREAIVVAPRPAARAGFLSGLGLEAVDKVVDGVVIATAVPSDPGGATAVPGVWVAGNVTDPTAQVIGAAAAGLAAGAAINADLVEEETRQALDRHRSGPFSAEAERELAARVAGDRRHGL